MQSSLLIHDIFDDVSYYHPQTASVVFLLPTVLVVVCGLKGDFYFNSLHHKHFMIRQEYGAISSKISHDMFLIAAIQVEVKDK